LIKHELEAAGGGPEWLSALARHSVHPTIDLTVDPGIPFSFRLSLGRDLRCSAIGCIAVRTQPAAPKALLEAKINILLLACLDMRCG